MQTHLQHELEKLKVTLMKMFAYTEKSLEKSVQSLLHRDDVLAQEVLGEDKDINRLEVEIEEQILNILALWQPVARDLRFVTGCSRVANDLERIGDQATNIAERAILLNQKPRLSFMNVVHSLSDVVTGMFRNVITAFSIRDYDLALWVCQEDTKADELNIQIIRQLIDYMANESIVIERSVHTIITANSLERVGDLATNIGEEVIFIAKGINVKHCHSFDANCQEDQ
ncbi:MAG TPA: phosphate signaling complex protein PhoU [Desulfohalobiaceae bacterium]|nr:phosphate signaling complex protein PhoU [Desulfohalobiaceae bacterium]